MELEVKFSGVAVDPFGATRAGASAEAEIRRKDFGMVWNAVLEAEAGYVPWSGVDLRGCALLRQRSEPSCDGQ